MGKPGKETAEWQTTLITCSAWIVSMEIAVPTWGSLLTMRFYFSLELCWRCSLPGLMETQLVEIITYTYTFIYRLCQPRLFKQTQSQSFNTSALKMEEFMENAHSIQVRTQTSKAVFRNINTCA